LYNNSANTKFTGKSIHFLPSCHSTNTEASILIRSQKAVNGLIVITNEQTAGRGQQGNIWLSEPNSNLTFSVIFFPDNLFIKDSFYLNMVSSLAIAEALTFFLPQSSIKVKWPNDIYTGNKKICGILIENTLRGEQITSAIVGIGLNVNQSVSNLPFAGSMIQEARHAFNLQEVLDKICEHLEHFYCMLEQGSKRELTERYLLKLFGLNEQLNFTDSTGDFSGYIRGINESGQLQIEKDSGTVSTYSFKEVHFLNKI
jgi:BirA family biotin operon repressor/biotin-[acetyl-CoA-carboxylase] ligase